MGSVPGQRLPDNFLEMDANALRQLFITSMVPVNVWSASNQLFDDNEQDTINWLCEPAFGLGGLRPVDAISPPKERGSDEPYWSVNLWSHSIMVDACATVNRPSQSNVAPIIALFAADHPVSRQIVAFALLGRALYS